MQKELRHFPMNSCLLLYSRSVLSLHRHANHVVLLNCRFEFRMNLRTGEVKQRQLSVLTIDFPRVNEEYTGR